MIKKYEDFIKESHSKTVKLNSEDVSLFTSEPLLQKLVADKKVSLFDDEVKYDESDIQTKEVLDQYLELPGKVEEKVGDFESFNDGDDEESLEPIGVDNLEAQGTNGLVYIFSPLESDMVEDWNNDTKVQKFIEEKRLFLSEIKYDEWSIYGIEGDKEVKNYIIKNYSF
jgi:hypothetical protein